MITELTPYIGGSAVTGVLGLLIRFGHQLWTTSLALKKTEEGSVTEITLSKHRRVRVDRSNRVMPHEHPTPERHELAKTQDAKGGASQVRTRPLMPLIPPSPDSPDGHPARHTPPSLNEPLTATPRGAARPHPAQRRPHDQQLQTRGP